MYTYMCYAEVTFIYLSLFYVRHQSLTVCSSCLIDRCPACRPPHTHMLLVCNGTSANSDLSFFILVSSIAPHKWSS